jgi:hypothetical protein
VERQVNEAIAGLPVSRVAEQQQYFNMLIYGNSGAGKTRLAGSSSAVPELRRILFIDVEGGTLTLRNTPYNEVEVVRVKSWQEMELVYDELYANPTQFNTVIVDSLTEIQKMSMDRVMRRLVEENDERDADVPGMREWNINIEQTRKFVRKFRDLPVNTIFTALETTEKDMRKGSLKRKPSLSGKVKDEVAAFLDIVVYLYIKEVGDENKRILLTGQTEDTVAKDRSNQLPMIIEDPTMASIYGYLTKEISANVA